MPARLAAALIALAVVAACFCFPREAAAQTRPTIVPSMPEKTPDGAPRPPAGTLAQRGQSLVGLVAFTGMAVAIGRLRGARRIPWRVLGWGLALQFGFGVVVLYA